MGKKIELEFISAGFKEILCSSGVQNAVESAAAEIQAKANAGLSEDSEGFSARTWIGNYGGGRWVGSVTTTDWESRAAEAENKVLSGAV